MTTKEEMSKLLGKEILLRSTAFGGEYYVGMPTLTGPVEVYFNELYYLFNSHPLEFTKKTGVIVQPRCPGFFKFPYSRLDPCPDPSFMDIQGIEILEINKEEP